MEWKIAVNGDTEKILLAGVGLVVVLSAMQFILPRENEKNAQAQLRIGAGDDISGYLVQEILSQQDSPVQLSEQSMEGYEFQDC